MGRGGADRPDSRRRRRSRRGGGFQRPGTRGFRTGRQRLLCAVRRPWPHLLGATAGEQRRRRRERGARARGRELAVEKAVSVRAAGIGPAGKGAWYTRLEGGKFLAERNLNDAGS